MTGEVHAEVLGSAPLVISEFTPLSVGDTPAPQHQIFNEQRADGVISGAGLLKRWLTDLMDFGAGARNVASPSGSA